MLNRKSSWRTYWHWNQKQKRFVYASKHRRIKATKLLPTMIIIGYGQRKLGWWSGVIRKPVYYGQRLLRAKNSMHDMSRVERWEHCLTFDQCILGLWVSFVTIENDTWSWLLIKIFCCAKGWRKLTGGAKRCVGKNHGGVMHECNRATKQIHQYKTWAQ